jgi:2-C-methyl-D-erythritol 4-phosphate cytidylyltransferase
VTAAVILVAAGSGSRLGHALPKALVLLGGEPLVTRAARSLLGGLATADLAGLQVVVTAPADHLDDVALALQPVAQEVAFSVVPGGATRQASVAAALRTLPAEVDVVLVHDAARPTVPAHVVASVLAAVRSGHRAVVPGVPVADTVKRVAAGADVPAAAGTDVAAAGTDVAAAGPAAVAAVGTDVAAAGPAAVAAGAVARGLGAGAVLRVTATLPRDELRAVQTPQGFARDLLERAHRAAAGDAGDESAAASDDAGLVERLGEQVWVVAGDERAAKITTARDLAVAELLLARESS